MEVLFLLIPLAAIVAAVIAAFFFWSVKSGQFDDLEGPAHSILMDDDAPQGRFSSFDERQSAPEGSEEAADSDSPVNESTPSLPKHKKNG